MAKKGVAWLSEEATPFQGWRDIPYIPATDNEPGAPKALLKANSIFRGCRWPAPYDRTRHEMILGDARDLSTTPKESVHLIVTSPPYYTNVCCQSPPEISVLCDRGRPRHPHLRGTRH